MKPSDPFSTNIDDDRTILRPSPGGRRRQTTIMPSSQKGVAGLPRIDGGADFSVGDNPLVSAAFPLLSIAPKLRAIPIHHAANELQNQLVDEIHTFEARSISEGCPQEQVKIASYFLCSFIDEAVLSTPWGDQSNWGQQSLLIQFHREATGGERFFQLLDQINRHPAQGIHLLELAYLCLSLGFEGKYRVEDTGLRELDRLRQELFVTIQRVKGDAEQPLSPHWQGLRAGRIPIVRHMPLWVVAVVTGAMLIAIYLGFAYAINRSSNQVYKQLASFAREEIKKPPVHVHSTASPAMHARIPVQTYPFKSVLEAEIAQQMVEVVDENRLRITGAFPSGSDRMKKGYLHMLEKIALELQADGRLITVIGHTDNRPIFSARFPSNWHLSQARAKHVADVLRTFARLEGRIRHEGHADSEPIAPNDTAANRALNRRIEIWIR